MITKLDAFIKACEKNGLNYKYNAKTETIKIILDNGNEVVLDSDLNIVNEDIKL